MRGNLNGLLTRAASLRNLAGTTSNPRQVLADDEETMECPSPSSGVKKKEQEKEPSLQVLSSSNEDDDDDDESSLPSIEFINDKDDKEARDKERRQVNWGSYSQLSFRDLHNDNTILPVIFRDLSSTKDMSLHDENDENNENDETLETKAKACDLGVFVFTAQKAQENDSADFSMDVLSDFHKDFASHFPDVEWPSQNDKASREPKTTQKENEHYPPTRRNRPRLTRRNSTSDVMAWIPHKPIITNRPSMGRVKSSRNVVDAEPSVPWVFMRRGSTGYTNNMEPVHSSRNLMGTDLSSRMRRRASTGYHGPPVVTCRNQPLRPKEQEMDKLRPRLEKHRSIRHVPTKNNKEVTPPSSPVMKKSIGRSRSERRLSTRSKSERRLLASRRNLTTTAVVSWPMREHQKVAALWQ